MDIKNIPYLLGIAKTTLIDLTTGADEEERKQASRIQQTIEQNFAVSIQDGKISKSNYDARVFQSTNKELFSGKKKPVAKEILEHDLQFYEAIREEMNKKEKELFLFIKGLAQTVKENIPDNTKDEDIFMEFSNRTSELNQDSKVTLTLFLKYYFCQQALEYINQIKSDQVISLSDLTRTMKEDLHKISFIATCNDKECKNFQKIIELPEKLSKTRLAKREAYLQKKLNETITLLIISVATEKKP